MSKSTAGLLYSGRDLPADARAAFPEPLIKAEQVAQLVGTSVGQLAQWRFHGDGPPFIKLGRSVRYRWSDVEAWLDDNTRTQT